MNDIWSVLLQTLTASGVAALLLALKAMFRDKLSPQWQFAAWGVLAMVLLRPAGWRGRYVLFNWPFYVELLGSTDKTKYMLGIPYEGTQVLTTFDQAEEILLEQAAIFPVCEKAVRALVKSDVQGTVFQAVGVNRVWKYAWKGTLDRP